MVVPVDQAIPNLLLRQARERRNLTQDEVADGLIQLGAMGATGGLVSKWERGVCRPSRFHRRLLCRFFDATLEQLGLDAGVSSGRGPEESIRATLLEPARASVKLSWLVWSGTGNAAVVDRVTRLIDQLSETVTNYGGNLRQPSLELLACGYEMLGKVAFDRLDHGTAYGHFLEMQQLGEALDDADILELAAVHQRDLLRRRGEYELAVQRLRSAASYAPRATGAVEGLRPQTLARAHAEHAYAGNVDVGVRLGIEGLAFARRYDSPRHVSRVQRMYDRLGGTPIGSSARMRDLAEALRAA